MKYFKLLLSAAVITAITAGCEKNNNPPEGDDYSNGIYVVNEGSFGSSNGSISYVNPDDGIIINGIFEAANGRPLGDVVQSITIVSDTLGYIVVNGSSKVEIVALKTFKTLANPIPVYYPRYFLPVGPGKGYLSAGNYEGRLYVIDLNSNTKVDSIGVGYGPENMVMLNDLVYVINSGGWSLDSTISIVNTASDEVVDTINVGKVPSDIALDEDNNIWVYCKGYNDYIAIETEALLQKINPVTNRVIWQSKVGMAGDYGATPPKCTSSKDGSTIFYLKPDGVYKINAASPELQEDPMIPGSYYGLEVNPSDGNIYVFEATSFTGNGMMKIFDENGNSVAEGAVGITPNGAVFNLN